VADWWRVKKKFPTRFDTGEAPAVCDLTMLPVRGRLIYACELSPEVWAEAPWLPAPRGLRIGQGRAGRMRGELVVVGDVLCVVRREHVARISRAWAWTDWPL